MRFFCVRGKLFNVEDLKMCVRPHPDPPQRGGRMQIQTIRFCQFHLSKNQAPVGNLTEFLRTLCLSWLFYPIKYNIGENETRRMEKTMYMITPAITSLKSLTMKLINQTKTVLLILLILSGATGLHSTVRLHYIHRPHGGAAQ